MNGDAGMNGDDGDGMGVPAGATSYRAICAGVGTESRIVTLSPSIPIIPFLTLFAEARVPLF